MAIGKFSCDHCGPRIVGHKADCPIWKKEPKMTTNKEAMRESDVLHRDIMNLCCNELHAGTPNAAEQAAYGRGFKDARHAAAELAQSAIAHSEASHADEIARLKYVEEAYKAECNDFDRVLAKIGIGSEDARTEGGVLQVARICNHLQEIFDALKERTEFGADMAGKYSAVCQQLSVANAAIAMKDEALKEIRNNPHTFARFFFGQIDAALSATTQQVSEWEAKKLEPLRKEAADWKAACHADRDRHYAELEPLRREVAALRAGYEDTFKDLEILNNSPVIGPSKAIGMMLHRMVQFLDDTQATAQAYEQEAEARGAVKALEEAAKFFDGEHFVDFGCTKYAREGYASSAEDVLRGMAEELRATSKKG